MSDEVRRALVEMKRHGATARDVAERCCGMFGEREFFVAFLSNIASRDRFPLLADKKVHYVQEEANVDYINGYHVRSFKVGFFQANGEEL